MVLTISDENMTGSITNELTLDGLSEQLTVRELIRSRVYQEADDYNRRLRQSPGASVRYNGLVSPSALERSLNDSSQKRNGPQEIDWKKQFAVACDAFERNGFFILVGNRQAASLEEIITIQHDTRVSFVKLTPLVGG